jgi:hypothetical protein
MHRCLALLALALLASALPTPSLGGEREYVVRWLPPEGTAPDGYRLHVLSEDRRAESDFDIGFVPTDPDGVGRYTILLPTEAGSFLSMTSYNASGESPPSNEIFVEASLCEPSLCDDGNPCTADDCGAAGCTSTQLPDGSLCSAGGDVCMQGQCGVTECVSDADCPSAGACTGAARCESFTCVAGPALSCGEPTQCAVPICDANLGCQMVALPDGTACDDGDGATRRDRCTSGLCQGVVKTSGGNGKGRGRR